MCSNIIGYKKVAEPRPSKNFGSNEPWDLGDMWEPVLYWRVMFLYTKIHTLRKNQDKVRYIFMYKKADNLRCTIFHGILKLAVGGGGGHFQMQNTMHFALHFYLQNTMHFALRFYI